MRYIIDAIYFTGFVLAIPFYLWRMVFQGRYRRGWDHRFGLVPRRHGLQPTIWIHGVSVGEVNAAKPLVDEIQKVFPGHRVVISSTTDTGFAAAEKCFAPSHMVFHWPFDFSWSVSRALNRIRPALVVLMEGEAWPNFLAECNRRKIPAMIANGRMSPDKGYPRYKKLGKLATALFNRLDAIGVQDELYGEKYVDLGVDPVKIHLTGMLKFESVSTADRIDGCDELASAMGISDKAPLLVAGGTGNDEEAMVIDAWEQIAASHPSLQLAIVPRKPERFEEVAKLIASRGYEAVRRSQRADGCTDPLPEKSILLGDTMGELRKFYFLSTISFAGRSLVRMGGSDMIEAAATGTPTCFGPHTYNFPQTDGLCQHGCREVADTTGLAEVACQWLDDQDSANAAGEEARQYIIRQKGAARRNVILMCHLLGLQEPAGEGAIATEAVLQEK